jgi:cation diffusion facilitator CzcD-associated flavoprotein CzcO
MPEKTTNTIIIGAGAAGLACAACLKKSGIPFILLEKNNRVGEEWRSRYDRLHLHTPKQHSGLPYFPIPSKFPKYLSKNDFADYLEQYAATFELVPLFNQKVVSVHRRNENYEVVTSQGIFRSRNLIIASGYASTPVKPPLHEYNNFAGEVIHSSEYKNGEPFKNKNVLVVGFGNSACEIAICLYEHGAFPALSVRSGVNIIPREIGGISIITLAIAQQAITKLSPRLTDLINKPILRLMNGDVRKLGLQKLPYGPFTQVVKHKKIPLLDIGTMELIKEGKIHVFAGIKAISSNEVEFTDGRKEHFDSIIYATGYQTCINDFLKSHIDIESRQAGNITETNLPNLYFCGFNVSSTGMLREIGIEARKIAKVIARAGQNINL